jgi:hypothetical protein
MPGNFPLSLPGQKMAANYLFSQRILAQQIYTELLATVSHSVNLIKVIKLLLALIK